MFKLLIIFVTFYSCCTDAYNILGIFPLPAKSHNAIFEPIVMELAKRGHNVTIYTQFVQDIELTNYQQIDLSSCYQMSDNKSTKRSLDDATSPALAFLGFFHFITFFPYDNFTNCSPVLDLINTDVKYDVLISETFNSDFFFVLAYLLDIPSIGIAPSKPFPWISNYNGLPEHPGYIPNTMNTEISLKTLCQRSFNTMAYVLSLSLYDYRTRTKGDDQIRRFPKKDIPSLFEISKNISMLFTFTNFAINNPRPLPPNVVEIGGVHIKPVSPLPKNIERFINESKDGVIYFAMGSLIKGASFSLEKRDALLQAFSEISQRVIFKWEEDDLPGKPDNVMIAKWMPQRDILAHPNVKLFISHGGILGASEAVYEGVPILGIPIFGDQPSNIKSIQAFGAAELLYYKEITKDSVLEKIQLILNTPSYAKNAKELSRRYRDRPMSPLDTAVYWTEYVIRHKGAPHLKPSAVQMPWYQYLLLDVVAFISAILILVIFIVYYLFKIFFRLICKTQNNTKVKSN